MRTIFTIVMITFLLTVTAVSAVEQVNIRYGTNNTIIADGTGFVANQSYQIKYYADGVISKTVTVSTDVTGKWENIILISDMPSVAVGYYVCEYSTNLCSQNLYSKYFLNIPNEMSSIKSQIDNKTDMINDIIDEFRNQTNITLLRKEWGDARADLLLTLGKMNETINSFDEKISSIDSRIQAVNDTVPKGVFENINVLNNRVNDIEVQAKADNEDLKLEIRGEIGSVQMVSFMTLLVVIIVLVAIVFLSRKGKMKFGKKNDEKKETAPIIIALGENVKPEDLEKLKTTIKGAQESEKKTT